MLVSEIVTIAEENKFTEWAALPAVSQLLIAGISDSTVTFQGTPDDGATVYDIETFTAETFKTVMLANTPWKFRAGVKTGDYGSDNILLRLEA